MSSLNPDAARIREMGAAALDRMVHYYEQLPNRRTSPRETAREIRALVQQPLPEDGRPFEEVLQEMEDRAFALSRQNGHPRFFGYVASPGTAAASLADMLASTLNANITSWRSAPAGSEIEQVTIDWIKQIVNFDPAGIGLFVSGGSMANFSALAAARSAKAGVNVTADGMHAVGRTLRLYASEETHFSVDKAAALLGIGAANVRAVRTDPDLRINIEDLVRQIESDLAAGYQPFCLVANAGTVGTGAFDPLGDLAAIARRYGLWLHVDGSYGGFAALAPSRWPFFAHMPAADSLALDPHKWLYLPVDIGCVLYRDPAAARAAFSINAEYIRVLNREPDEAFAFWEYGPELSRRFRALNVWMLLKHVGTRALGEAIERNIACAKYLERLVCESADFEMLAPVELSVFSFRYKPLGCAEDGLDFLNQETLQALQRDGSSYLSNTRVRGRFALRGCVLNYRTTERDMEILLDDIRRVAQPVTGSL
jgi:glutamate/tyrosine decarboxylase-like PLP-dependent enzyme